MPFTRRAGLVATSLLATSLQAGSLLPFAPVPAHAGAGTEFDEIERRLGGRLGLAGLDTGTGRWIGHREAERFPLCSTFKLLAAGLVLARVDRTEERLARRVGFAKADLVPNSPLTEPHAGRDGMTIAEICHAAITRSDNTAGNLMLASFGGPPALTAFLRGLGDEVTRLDRTEIALNEALPDDPRDTTNPAAMIGSLHRLLLGETLSEPSRRQLADWLVANETGATRIRASAPAGWRVGDKTGTGDRGAAGDVAILWPPGKAPILLAIYLHGSEKPIGELSGAIAAAARMVFSSLSAA